MRMTLESHDSNTCFYVMHGMMTAVYDLALTISYSSIHVCGQ